MCRTSLSSLPFIRCSVCPVIDYWSVWMWRLGSALAASGSINKWSWTWRLSLGVEPLGNKSGSALHNRPNSLPSGASEHFTGNHLEQRKFCWAEDRTARRVKLFKCLPCIKTKNQILCHQFFDFVSSCLWYKQRTRHEFWPAAENHVCLQLHQPCRASQRLSALCFCSAASRVLMNALWRLLSTELATEQL